MNNLITAAEAFAAPLWAVAMRPEGYSPFKQTPAASKEIAERAVERYRKMHEKEGHNFFLEIFDDVIKVQKWHGSRKEHIKNLFYVESWFSEPMYQCFDLKTAERVFKFDEIVKCYKKGSAPLVTKSFDEAKQFYGSSMTGFKYQIQPIEPPENIFNWFLEILNCLTHLKKVQKPIQENSGNNSRKILGSKLKLSYWITMKFQMFQKMQ